MKDIHVVGKKMARNGHKMAIYESYIFFFFLTKLQKNGRKKMFNGIAFDLIKIIRSLKASQNDCQILIFVKAIYVVGEKMTRNS